MDPAYFMRKALALAKIALDNGEFPVACVLAEDSRVVVSGSRIGTTGNSVNEIDHAEIIALKRLSGLKNPPDPGRLTLFTTLEPCMMCFGALLISGIRSIVYAYEDAMGGATRCDLSRLPPLYRRGTLSVVPNILRSESITLFKAFFTNPQNIYLKESFLAAYTLRQ